MTILLHVTSQSMDYRNFVLIVLTLISPGQRIPINDNNFFYSYDMYSKCHSMYLKWTYFCNRHGRNFALGKLSSKSIINSNRHSLHDSSQCLP